MADIYIYNQGNYSIQSVIQPDDAPFVLGLPAEKYSVSYDSTNGSFSL